MPTLSWTLNAQVQNGPTLGVVQALAIDAFDNTQVIIPASKDNTLDLQPGTVTFLAITADRYGSTLTYKVNTTGSAVHVDAPQVLTGGAVGLLGLATTGTNSLVFTNGDTKPITVQVLVGRTVG